MQRIDGEGPGLRKTAVTCKTCGITDSFYSDLSVEAFKAKHNGHDVQGGEKRPRAPREVRPKLSEDAIPSEEADGVKVTRVLVDLVHDPARTEPALRIRGYIDGVDEAFSFTSEEGAKVKDLVTKGKYYEASTGKLFVWEEYAVDFEDGSRDKLELAQETVEETAPTQPEPVQPVSAHGSGAQVAVQERRPQAVRPAAQAPPAREEDVLLVSKSWYVQGGNKNKEEALRVSRVLKGFRWKVEPIYTIGVVLDDLLSIETSRNEVSRELIVAVEGAGYRLSAVTIETAKLIAWFKKASGEPDEPDELEISSADEGGLVDEVVQPMSSAPASDSPN